MNPDTLTQPIKLFPYQNEGVEWLSNENMRRKLLGDGMGLGKSAQVIRAADKLNLRKMVIVCPSIARLTWEREFKKFSLLPSRKIKILESRTDRAAPDDEIILCSFDYATHNFAHLARTRRNLFVVDESHFVKEWKSARTSALLGVKGLIHSAPRTWFLSGTPVPNMKPNEAWPMLFCFGATKLTYDAFLDRYCEYYLYRNEKVPTGPKRATFFEFKMLLNSVMLRREKQEVLKDLPPIITSIMPVEAALDELTPQLKEEFRLLENKLSNISHFTPLQQLGVLEGVAGSIGTLRRYCAMMKVKPVCEVIADELERNEYGKIVVFGIHREALIGVEQRLSRFGSVRIGGDTSMSLRQRHIDRFQNDPTCRVLAGNIRAAGTNITLTAADQMVALEQEYTPGNNEQAYARANRIGSVKPLNLRIAALAHTVDINVQEILSAKIADLVTLYAK